MITICYLTNRDNPRFDWFRKSFNRQYNNEVKAEIVVINGSNKSVDTWYKEGDKCEITEYRPKPTPWQGPHRITKDNWFAASNARNTGIIYANGTYIVYVDDLSVLCPTWWQSVVKAYNDQIIILGAYKKVKDLTVEDGRILHYEETPNGNDHRLNYGSRWAGGSWLYGCSCGFPIEYLLEVNGWDEINDGISYEDVQLGIRLEKKGHRMYYSTDMLTLECEECHSEGIPFRREDPLLTLEQYEECRNRMGITGWHEKGGRTDTSHLLMDMVNTRTRPDNFWTWGNHFNLRKLKASKAFQLPTGDELFWPNLQPIKNI